MRPDAARVDLPGLEASLAQELGEQEVPGGLRAPGCRPPCRGDPRPGARSPARPARPGGRPPARARARPAPAPGSCAPRRPGSPRRASRPRCRSRGRAGPPPRSVGCFVRLSVTLTPSASNVPRATAAWTGRYAGSSAGPPTATVTAGGSAAPTRARRSPPSSNARASAACRLAARVLIMGPPCWRRRRSCPGPIRGAAASSGSTIACTGGTARSAGGRPARGSR